MFAKKMKHFLVTLASTGNPSLLGALSDILSEGFDFWASEFDDGLFFISSELSAEDIFDALSDSLDLDLPNTLYVFQLAGAWAGFGTTNVREALSERLKDR